MTDGETASDPQIESKGISETTTDLHPLRAHSSRNQIKSEPSSTTGDPLHKNGYNVENEHHEPPAKRRRVSGGQQTSRKKPVSPPWKRIAAEGPSSFTQDGLRKSGRTNAVPFELQPQSDKRQTRGARRQYSVKGKHAITNGLDSQSKARDTPDTNRSKRPSSSSDQYTSKSPSKAFTSPKRSKRKSMPSDPVYTPVRSCKKASTPKNPQSAPSQTHPSRARHTRGGSQTGNDDEPDSLSRLRMDEASNQTPKAQSRIKFRVKPATLPYPNALLVRPRPKQFSTLEEYLEKAVGIPVQDGGLATLEDGSVYTPEVVLEDARLLTRMEEAAEPGGILSREVCSVYQNEEPVPIPRQYAHQDHINAAVMGFRRLMNMEQRKHRANAKRIAEACRDEWARRQPKSLEELEAEEIQASQVRYKGLVKVLQSTWENVRAEVNRRRLLEWEAQEKIRARKALNEAVDMSTQKLQAIRAHMDMETSADENEDDESQGSASDSGSETNDEDSNMSNSGSGSEDGADDDGFTEEQLLEYTRQRNLEIEEAEDRMSDVEELKTPDPEPAVEDALEDTFDDSDESIDMDDDLGSSDDGNDSEEEESSEDDEDTDEPGEISLLGFLPASDLAVMEQDIVDELDENMADPAKKPVEDDSVDEMDEVSLIPDATEYPEIDKEKDSTTPNVVFEEAGINKAEQEIDSATSNILSDSASGNIIVNEVITEAIATSPDRSSQPTLRTSESRPSDADSVTSVDHHNSRHITRSASPGNDLKTPVPFLLRGTLREYQHYGLDWLANLYANNTNGILADEMGLGKTIQTIALLAHLACKHEVWGPHLVIVPTSVMLNWEMEFKKWCPGFKILTYYGNQEERKRKRQGWRTDDHWNVCITSYQLILADQQVFKRRRWHYMILDEAHNIKNFQSQRWQTMLTFSTRARLLLTGTPLQNNLTELWSLLYFLMPSDGTEQGVGGFANLKEFQDWFKKPSEQILEHGRETMDDESRAIISKLHRVLRPYLLRRLKADVEKQMPAKYEHVEWCRLSKRQRELYDGFLSRDDTRGTLASGNYLSIINCLMQLRKVCNHPDLFIERAIMTSFPMERSVLADFEIKDLLVRRRFLRQDPMTQVSLEFLNLVPAKHELLSEAVTSRSAMLTAQRTLMDLREAQRVRANNAYTTLDTTTAKSNLVYLESASRWGRFEELQHCVYLNALRRQQKPIYGTKLVEFLTLNINERPLRPQPKRRDQLITWLENRSPTLISMVPTIAERSQSMNTLIQKFACVTPPVIARDMTSLTLSSKGVEEVQSSIDRSTIDPYHEARMRLSIQFPDKRLLQYDCGKLQALAKLLRKLQAGGHRALIFTQMTKVLDILEQFLNIHGHKYLRLDGSTKIEQRQVLTDRFNNDTRILAFILSTRSGGLGINLTGADTVIFYDLDWNPAMDKQCQDRCHRIGQTRDVHIYRLVSEHTIEANILRKANQKQMLDDVVIQEGDFTTDYFNKMKVGDVIGEESGLLDGDEFANAAMDRVLGGVDNNKDMQRVIAQAEDREDVAAARIAEKEIVQTDAADFDENVVTNDATPAEIGTPRDGAPTPATDGIMSIDDAVKELGEEDEDETNAWGERIKSTDEYMLNFMTEQLKDTPVERPKDKNKIKKGKDHRLHRAR